MRRIAYLFLAAISLLVAAGPVAGETRPRYGGTLRVMLQAAPNSLDLPTNTTPTTAADYWDLARTLSLVGDTLVTLDAQSRPHAALAVAWQSDGSARHWQFTLRHGVKFHDGTAASPAAIAQILGALHPDWTVRPSSESVSAESLSIDSDAPMPSLLAELALPRNLLLKRNPNGLPIGTGPFLVAEWQPGKLLRLAANEESWAGRPFVDAVQIEYGKSFSDQAIALELGKADVIESAPSASAGLPQHTGSPSSSSLPVELLALVFPANSKAQDPRVREALALAIDRKPIQSVLLKGAGEPTASILPNWMTGYSAVFSARADPERARAVLAGLPQPELNRRYNLSYDPRDPQAQLIAERIALNAHEVGITVQVSLSGAEDIRLLRVVLPSPDPATSLAEAARQLELPQPAFAAKANNPVDDGLPDARSLDAHSSDGRSLDNHSSDSRSLDDLYQAERNLLQGYAVIPLFQLPVATAANARVRNWAPDRLGAWNDPEFSLANVWLENAWPENVSPQDGRPRADSQ
jgi:peptide/nickel transport system substrate-binding protein